MNISAKKRIRSRLDLCVVHKCTKFMHKKIYSQKYEGPKLLFLDGHNSHISLEVIECAIANQISIICFPPHTSHILQPLDKGVYGPAKTAWRLILCNFFLHSTKVD
jgi:hypothetical protein